MADIFISYSRKDSEQALSLAERLRGEGIEVWIDKQGIVGAEKFAAEIVEAINGCSTFLILISDNAVQSDSVLKELAVASESRKRILPVYLHPTVLPPSFIYPLAGLQRVKISDFDGIVRAHKYGIERIAREDTRKSLIILPFEDLSPAQDHQWFADGLAGELIDAMSRITSLRILDRTTSKGLRGVKQTMKEIGGLFHTRYFVEGSVAKFADKIKVTAALIDIDSGEHLWQDSIKGTMEDIFDIQESVAARVVEGLKLILTKEEKEKIKKKPTENTEAYELHLRAGEYFIRHTKPDLEQALVYYEEAVRLDPHFATAYSNIANTYQALYRQYDRSETLLVQAEAALEKGREIEGETPEYCSTMSLIALRRGDTDRSLQFALRSVELDPAFANGFNTLGEVYVARGMREEAVQAWEEFVRLLGNDSTAHFNLLIALSDLGDAPGAKERLRTAAERAIPVIERYVRLNPGLYHAQVQLANVFRYAGREAEALDWAEKLSTVEIQDGFALYDLACLYLHYQDRKRGMATLRRSMEKGFRNIEVFRRDPDLDPLRETPEFADLMKEMEAHING